MVLDHPLRRFLDHVRDRRIVCNVLPCCLRVGKNDLCIHEPIDVREGNVEESVDISLSTRHEAGRFAPRGKPNALGAVNFGGLPVEATSSKVRDDFFIVCAP
jgi:hypothetical protein